LKFLITFEETPVFIWDARYPNRMEVTKVFCRNTLSLLPITQPTPNQVRSLKTKHRPPHPQVKTMGHFKNERHITQKNWEISTLMIKKRWSEVNTYSTSHREFQRRKGKTENKGPRNKNQNIKAA
jgi:hypothetical protein